MTFSDQLTHALILAWGSSLHNLFITRQAAGYETLFMNQLRKQSIAGLNRNFERTVTQILAYIEDSSRMLVLRKRCIQVMETTVRWDNRLLERFESLSRKEELSPEIRRHVEAVIIRKRKEIRQNTNPEWDPELARRFYQGK